MGKVLMIKGNTETYVDEISIEAMKDKGYEVVEVKKSEPTKTKEITKK